jgi:hypothetical protein
MLLRAKECHVLAHIPELAPLLPAWQPKNEAAALLSMLPAEEYTEDCIDFKG